LYIHEICYRLTLVQESARRGYSLDEAVAKIEDVLTRERVRVRLWSAAERLGSTNPVAIARDARLQAQGEGRY
jgi:hypothetical protein